MDPSKLKVAELKEELSKRGLSIKGLKAELVARLEEALKGGEAIESVAESTAEPVVETTVETVVEESPKKRRGRSASIDTPTKVPKVETDIAISETVMEAEPAADLSMTVAIDNTNDEATAIVEQAGSIPVTKASVMTSVAETSKPEIKAQTLTQPKTQQSTPQPAKAQTQAKERIVHVNYLTRPFTLAEFKSLLGSFGEIEDLWLDSLKSQSFVTFVDFAGAEKCQEVLNGKRFPEQTGKCLAVEIVSSERMNMIKKELEGLAATAIGATLLNTYSNSPESANVPLDELFKKTTAEPSIYYLPKQ